jgi:predicted amidohydrolase YtcJ
MIHLLKASALLCISIYSITAAANPPDTIFYNGKILTVDPQFSVAEAVAISDGRIVAIGSNAEILELTESQTKQCDLEGHTVIPGLIDNHMHYMRGGSRWRFEARIDGVTSRKKALNIISQRAMEIEPGQWVFVLGGWNEQQFSDAPGGFTTEELDAAAPNNPVFIQKSYSKAYMNSLAEHELARSKNDSSRESRQQNNSSTTQRRSNRSSSGRSQTGRSSSRRSGGARTIINQATTYVPSRSESERVEDIVLFNSVLNSHGLTTVYDVGRSTDGNFDPVKTLAEQDALTVRVFHSLRYRANNPIEVNEALTFIKSSEPRSNNDWFGLIGIGEHTYNPLHDSSMRVSLYDDDVWQQFQRIALYAAEGGWHIHEHAMQDSTASRILDIAQVINKDYLMKDLRWTIAHCDLISDKSIERAKELGLTIAIHNKTAKPAMDDRDSPPIASIQDSGIIWGLGSDSTVVSTINPFHSLWWVTSGKVFPNKESIKNTVSRQAALTAHTRNNAFLLFKENDLGSIEVGKWADLVVLDRDYMTVPVDEIREISPLQTIVRGEIVYDSAN